MVVVLFIVILLCSGPTLGTRLIEPSKNMKIEEPPQATRVAIDNEGAFSISFDDRELIDLGFQWLNVTFKHREGFTPKRCIWGACRPLSFCNPQG